MKRLAVLGVGVMVTAAVAVGHSVGALADSDSALKLGLQTTGTPPQRLTIDLHRWSSDAERAPLLAAMTTAPAPGGGGRPGGGRGAAGGSASGAAARGAGSAPASAGQSPAAGPPDSPSTGGAEAPAAPGRGATGRGAGGGRGARGGGRGAAPTVTPVARLAAAVKAAPTLGYVWGSGITGYSIKYAWRSPAEGRPARLVLVTDRRLDVPVSPDGSPPDAAADFTVIEIRFDSKGAAQGKTSLATGAVVDQGAGTIAVQDFDKLPLQLRVTP